MCSVGGVCHKLLRALSRSRAAPGAQQGSAAPDRVPPSLTLLGNGTAALTLGGAPVMLDTVAWSAAWRDPGVAALDDVDGDLTGSVQALGAGGEQQGDEGLGMQGCHF